MLRLKCTDSDLALASAKIKNGAVVVYPTDTVYGLGCDPYNDSAVEKILKIKGREEGKPMPLLCSSIEHAYRVGKFDASAKKLAEKFWPGALTIVVELIDDRISRLVSSGSKSIGLRVPDLQSALKLIDACNGILVGTSANRSGFPSARSANDVTIESFDILIDGGSTHGIESTVLKISDSKVTIIREGSVKRETIEEVLKTHV